MAFYPNGIVSNGLFIYNNTNTIFSKDTSTSNYDYANVVSRIDQNGDLVTTYSIHLCTIGTGYNAIQYGATDWRGNVYLGGTFTNFIVTPVDSVVNTDPQSGNFFIAKLGMSDCSCPTPGVQFT